MNSFIQFNDDLNHISEKDIFFIIGMGKSGTTWLQHILNGHPEISCKGESHAINDLIPKVMKIMEAHNGLIRGKNKMMNQETDGYPEFVPDDATHIARTLLFTLLRAQVGDKEVKVIGEKTPSNTHHLQVIKERLVPQAKFIHIIRDGRDGAVSGWHHMHRTASPEWMQEKFPSFLDYVDTFSREWRDHLLKARGIGQAYPGCYLELRYELLHEQPAEQIKRILDFLEVDSREQWIEVCKNAGSFKKLSQGRNQGEEKRDSHFRKGIVGDWRTLFDDACVRKFNEHAGGLLEELGYRW